MNEFTTQAGDVSNKVGKGVGYLGIAGVALLMGFTVMATVNGSIFIFQTGDGNKNVEIEGQLYGGDKTASDGSLPENMMNKNPKLQLREGAAVLAEEIMNGKATIPAN